MTEIAIIGPTSSGKTTYLAALAHLSEANIFPGLDIRLLGDENSQTLLNSAFNLIELKDIVGQTELGNEPAYGFTIIIPAGKYGVKKPQKIKLSFVDYAGEVFEKIYRRPDEVNSYINQLMKVEAWMVMLTDFQPGNADREYKRIMESLWEKINSTKIRIAVVMSKCERGEIWPGRLDPDHDLFKVRLPKTYKYLTNPKNKISRERLRFFACSSFGVRGFQDPRPNRETFYKDLPSEFAAVIRDDCPWKPYGLISPLYWLSKGKILSDSRI
jgi:hypothetical protein